MAQVATPKQLPMQLRPQNHPYNAHTNCLSKELIRNHRQNMVPLATALKQKAAACKTSVSNHGAHQAGGSSRGGRRSPQHCSWRSWHRSRPAVAFETRCCTRRSKTKLTSMNRRAGDVATFNRYLTSLRLRCKTTRVWCVASLTSLIKCETATASAVIT